jgi:hypothetical protein
LLTVSWIDLESGNLCLPLLFFNRRLLVVNRWLIGLNI